MQGLFTAYRQIDAKNIVRDNIQTNKIGQDLSSLIRTLTPLNLLSVSNPNDGTPLSDSIVDGLKKKKHTSDLLGYFGYKSNPSGVYVYRSTNDENEKRRRTNGVNEVRQLYQELNRFKNNDYENLKDFLLTEDIDSDEDTPLPNNRQIQQGNEKTFDVLKSLKTSIKPKYKGGDTHAFIRRQLARLLYRQVYPSIDDDDGDASIDNLIVLLKEMDAKHDKPRTDEVYIECFIRSHFDLQRAYQLLTKNRPHLEAPVLPKTSNNTSIDNIIGRVQQQAHFLSNCRFNRRTKDNWEKAEYLVPVILKIRNQCPNDQADEATFSKLHRLLFSELLPLIGTTIAFNIDIFARMLCSKSYDTIKNIDVGSLRTFLNASSATSMTENFFTDCPICYESFPLNRMESPFLCEHTCCSQCMKDYYRTAINDVRDASSISALTCYMERHPITDDTHHLFFIWLQTKIRQWFPDDPQLIDRYIDRVMNVASGKQIKKCGNSKCISSFFADENPTPTRVRCPDCQFAQCSLCCRKWNDEHKKLSCDQYYDWLYDNDPDDDDVKAIQLVAQNAIVCPNPNCKEFYVYQPGGCEHYICRTCRTEFCRMCSSLYYFDKKDPKCPIANCQLKKNGIHAHCPPNCFREIRDAGFPTFYRVLQENGIDALSELRQQYPAIDEKCPAEDCKENTVADSENRLCKRCYEQFLAAFIWYRRIEPWELYEDNQLEQILKKASVAVPKNPTRPILIQLCQQNLNKNLGKPQQIKRPRS